MSSHRTSDDGPLPSPPHEGEPKGEGTLARWSRRKAAARTGAHAEARPHQGGATPAAEPGERSHLRDASQRNRDHPAPEQRASRPLPDPEQLDLNSDFAAFLHPDVDAELQRAALRRLWTLDPVFADLDGLVDYAEDFTDAAKATSVVRTVFHVARNLTPPEPARKVVGRVLRDSTPCGDAETEACDADQQSSARHAQDG